ncbi:MAG: hypothetical protein AAB631_02450 [Patescibacteria group bacterium]
MDTAKNIKGRILTSYEKRLRIRMLESEKNLRAALRDFRERGEIQGYFMGERGVTWVRYGVTLIPDRGDGFATPKMIINVRATQGFIRKPYHVGGNATLVNVLVHDILCVKDWTDILKNQIAVRLKGWAAEERLYELCKRLAKRDDNPIVTAIPVSVHDDRIQGIDLYLVCTIEGKGNEKIPLQCKSSVMGQQKHQEQAPKIPSIVVSPYFSDEMIEEKILRLISAFKKGQIVNL